MKLHTRHTARLARVLTLTGALSLLSAPALACGNAMTFSPWAAAIIVLIGMAFSLGAAHVALLALRRLTDWSALATGAATLATSAGVAATAGALLVFKTSGGMNTPEQVANAAIFIIAMMIAHLLITTTSLPWLVAALRPRRVPLWTLIPGTLTAPVPALAIASQGSLSSMLTASTIWLVVLGFHYLAAVQHTDTHHQPWR